MLSRRKPSEKQLTMNYVVLLVYLHGLMRQNRIKIARSMQ
jgi:hypothetical protein